MAKKILLVEDEDIMINLLQKKLTNAGYEVLVARDGEEGLKLMKESRPDLILLDIIMPKKNGFDVMEEMEKEESLKEIPIIVISNSGQPVDIERALKLGAKDCLIKTEFDPEEVVEKIEKYIRK